VLAETGKNNNISVIDEELSRAIVERVRQFPGRATVTDKPVSREQLKEDDE
jgi:hypothetical protein